MELKNFFAQDDAGNVLSGATCYVFRRGTETLVPGLRKANGTDLANPFVADLRGFAEFAAPNGLYDVRVVKGARDYRIRMQFNDVAGTVEAAQVAAGRAEVARDAAQLAAGVFSSTQAGLAATVHGNFFSVPSATINEYLILYKNTAGVAVEVKRYPSTGFLDSNFKEVIHAEDAVPLVVDDANNVPIWLRNGLLGVTGFDPTAVQAIRGSLGSTLLEQTPDFWPPFVILSENDRVLMVSESEGGSSFFGGVPNVDIPITPPESTPEIALATSGAGLYAWRARIAAGLGGTGIAKILYTGDSWAEHLAYIARPLSQSLYAAYGQSGNGWVSVNADVGGQLLNGALLSKSAGWTLSDMDAVASDSLDGHALSATGTTATITLTGLKTQSLKWYYKDGDGAFSYSIDGGASVTVTGGNTNLRKSITIDRLSDTAHTIVFSLANNTGKVVFYGGYATRTVSGIEFSKAGNGGSMAHEWGALASYVQTYVSDINPDAIVLVLGTNDSRQNKTKSVFKTGIKALVDAYRAGAPNAGIILVAPPVNGQATNSALLGNYRDAMLEVAGSEVNVECLNLHDYMPGYSITNGYGMWSDNIHLSEAGGRYLTGLLFKHFLKTN